MPAEIRCWDKWSGSPTIGARAHEWDLLSPLRVFQFLLRVSRDSSDLQCNFRSRPMRPSVISTTTVQHM